MGISDSEKVIFLGDWHGHVGADVDGLELVHGGHGFGKRNPEGERVLDFALANKLVVDNFWGRSVCRCSSCPCCTL